MPVFNLLYFASHLVTEASGEVQVCKEENDKYPKFSGEADVRVKAQEDRHFHFNYNGILRRFFGGRVISHVREIA